MGILEILTIVLIIAWLGGFALSVGGSLIHILLVLAGIVIAARLLGLNI